MKNMYLAAAIIASLAFAACSEDETGKADRAYQPIEIFGNINDVSNVQNTRATNTAWSENDCIGVTVDTPEENASGHAVDVYTNIQYQNAGGNAFRVVNSGSTDNNIRLKGEGEFSLCAYYPYTGENGALPETEGIISKKISGTDQSSAKQPSIDFLYAKATGIRAESPVTFAFSHQMAKIVLKFKATNGATLNDMKVYLKSLRLGGTFNVITGEAVAKPEATPNSELVVDVVKPAEGEEQSRMKPYVLENPREGYVASFCMLMIPQDVSGKLLFEVNLKDGRKFSHSAGNGEGLWEAGHQYIYNIGVGKAGLKVTIDEDSVLWDGEDENVEGTDIE